MGSPVAVGLDACSGEGDLRLMFDFHPGEGMSFGYLLTS